MAQNHDQRLQFLLVLDDELLKGGVILSEWVSFIVAEADAAFVHGADLASILTAVSAIETHLRAEYGKSTSRLSELIDQAAVTEFAARGSPRSSANSESLGSYRRSAR